MAVGPIPPPLICERLLDLLPRFGGTRLAGFEPNVAVCFPNGRVFGPGNVLAPDGLSIARDVSPDFGKPADQHWLLNYKKMRSPVLIPGETAVVAVPLGDGYCHWLLEELPRLLVLRTRAPDSIIAHTRSLFIREALEFGRFPLASFREPTRYSHFECERLIVPVLDGEPGRPSARTAQLLTEFVAPLIAKASAFGERLYISREKATRRRVVNHAELWPYLEARGFTKICAEELTWAEQINAFAHAKVIVAPHGAGLANLVFCEPGTRVVEFFDRAYVNRCFERVAEIRGLDYRAIVTPSEGGPITCDPRANRRDIYAEVSAITDALTTI